MKNLTAVVAGLVFLLASCNFSSRNRVTGNGLVQVENRQESGFNGLEISGAVTVYVKQDSQFAVRVETDGNLIKYVETYTDNNTLVIRTRSGYNLRTRKGVKVYVSAPGFTHFGVSGASHIFSEGRISSNEEIRFDLNGASSAEAELKCPSVDLELTGASTARLNGETRDLVIEATGASHARCFELMTESTDADLSGASHADVFASVTLKASASGASHVNYKGKPEVSQSTSGAGSVSRADQ